MRHAAFALLLMGCGYKAAPHWEDNCTLWMPLIIPMGKTTVITMNCFQWEHVWVTPTVWR